MAYNRQFLSFSLFTLLSHHTLLFNVMETSDSMLLYFLPTYQPCLGLNSFPIQPRPPRYLLSHYSICNFWSLALLTPLFLKSVRPVSEHYRDSGATTEATTKSMVIKLISISLHFPSKLPLLLPSVTISNLHNSFPAFNFTSISHLLFP